MAAIVRGDDEQASADREAEEADEGIAETNAVEVEGGGFANEGAHLVIGAAEGLEGLLRSDARGGNAGEGSSTPHLTGRASAD